MTEIDLSRAEWQKSSYSSQSGNCVKVARNLPALVGIRDSKSPDTPKLLVLRDNLASVPPDPPRLAPQPGDTGDQAIEANGPTTRLP
jgi:hypothetical protein